MDIKLVLHHKRSPRSKPVVTLTPADLVLGANVEFRVLSGCEGDNETHIGNVRGVSKHGVTFDVIKRGGEQGRYRLSSRFVPFDHLDATVIDGTDVQGLLDWHFRPLLGGGGEWTRTFDVDTAADTLERDLLEKFVQLHDLSRLIELFFALLEHCEEGDYSAHREFQNREFSWLLAFDWRKNVPTDRYLACVDWLIPHLVMKSGSFFIFLGVALMQLRSSMKRCQSEAERTGRSCVFGAGIFLPIAILWQLMALHSPTPSDLLEYRCLAEELLGLALTCDRSFRSIPHFWLGVAPLPEMEVRHGEIVKESVLTMLRRYSYHELCRLRWQDQVTSPAWSELIEQNLAKILVEAWCQSYGASIGDRWTWSPFFSTERRCVEEYTFNKQERELAITLIMKKLLEAPDANLIENMFRMDKERVFFKALSDDERASCIMALGTALRMEVGTGCVGELMTHDWLASNEDARNVIQARFQELHGKKKVKK